MPTPRKGSGSTLDKPQMLTLADVSEHLQVSQSTVRRMIARGELRAYQYGPRVLRVDPRDLDRMRTQVAAATYAHVSGGDAA